MSRAKSSLLGASMALSLAFAGCSSVPAGENVQAAELNKAILEANAPASEEEIAAANRADPLTRANFWSKEYAKNPADLDVAITFANALRQIGSEDRAIDVASQTAVLHPGNADLLMIIGRSMVAKQDYVSAAQAFRRAAQYDPQMAAAWAALGTSFDRLDRHLDAQVAYEKALAIQPDRTSTLTNYGLSLALSGDLQGAEQQLLKAVAQPNADLRVRENLALIQGLQGKYEEMSVTSGAHAPNAIVRQNVEALQSMVRPTRNWDSLSETAELGATPPSPSMSTAAETPSASETNPVADTGLENPEGSHLRGALE